MRKNTVYNLKALGIGITYMFVAFFLSVDASSVSNAVLLVVLLVLFRPVIQAAKLILNTEEEESYSQQRREIK